MRRIRSLLLVFLVIALSSSVLSAFEFDQKRWRRDVRNLRRFAKLSEKMRSNFRAFADKHVHQKNITGEQHALADHTVQAYARIRHNLGIFVDRWRAALPPRETMADEGRLKGTVLAVAASSVLMENALCMVECFKGSIWEARLNEGAPDRTKWHVSGLFRDVYKSLASAENHEAVLKAMRYIDTNDAMLQKLLEGEDHDSLVYLLDLMSEASALGKIEQEGSFDRVTGDLKARLNFLQSKVKSGLNIAMDRISKAFGNTMGAVHIGSATVTGELRERVHDEMMAVLKPGDILLDKTRFALTDKFIPGHFGHVAMWLGTPEEMVDYGLFDFRRNRQSYKRAKEWSERLMSGHSVLEALRPGVEINTLEHFLNVDEVAVLRLKTRGSPEEHRKIIEKALYRGLYHLGQDYDFNFDVNTSNTIVCSELAYQAFPDSVHWPTSITMGRATISPDDVAVQAGPGEEFPFEVVFYHANGVSHSGADAWRAFWKSLKNDGAMPKADDPANQNLLKAIEKIQP